ncbi:MAG: FGGY family carbohydrate kinase [Haloplanus sp.]
MAPCIIGIDAGTSNIKAVTFDLDGSERATASRRNEVLTPTTDRVEQEMDRTWELTAAVLREVVADLDDASEVVGVGVTGQGDGCWLLGDDGDPVRNAILWNDGRAAAYVDRWQTDGRGASLYEACGCTLFPGSTLPILAWLRDNEPATLEDAATVFYCKDWLKYCLTGERTTDPSDASLPFLDHRTNAYATDLGERFDLPSIEECYPRLVPPADPIGTVTAEAAAATGLPEGVPVVSGLLDIAASALGSGAATEGDSSSVVGTTSLSQTFVTDPTPGGDPAGFTISLGFEDLYTRAMASMAGTPNLDWMLDELATVEAFADVEAAVRDLPVGAEGVLYHPYLSTAGERAPFVDPNARAQFTGIGPNHTRAHLCRAVYEGLALAMRDCYEHIDTATDTVYVSGGGTRSSFVCQLLADCLGVPVAVPAGTEFGAKGVALLCAVALEEYPDVATAVAETTAVETAYRPRPERTRAYDDLYDLYRMAYESMGEVWRARAEFLERRQS